MSLSTFTASRPGPLGEWPLERFLPSSSKSSGPSRPNKRPLSPGGPSLFSPAKRRILAQEGILSPEKTIKSPLKGYGVGFGDLLREPGSPAKKLDFGLPQPEAATSSASTRPSTPSRAVLSRSLAPSPELVSKASAKSTPRRTFDNDDFFATPDRLSSSKSSHLPPPLFNLVSRELPAPPDPQSVHYPGFVVHQDAHNPVINPAALDSLSQLEDHDEWKENVVPRRKVKKAITESVEGKSTLLTPSSKKLELEKLFKAKMTPATPRKTASKERHEVTSPTPRRYGLRSDSKTGTPVISEEEMKQRRRLLRDEVEDEVMGFDEDL
ncbi:hypothetical protein GYMLUDRAFT_795221 [Collybiopsis luxurians FD-317 M1]|nr:hypothetical protein GYMLUDRAFT_795221 [Collybiopsis luxurians FD-317 M1]